MKRFLVVLALLVLASTAAFGDTLDCGKFTVDVPAGWTGTLNGPSAIIIKDDKTASLSITYAPTQGYSKEALAAGFVQEFSKTFASVGTPEADDDGDFTWTMTTPNGVESHALLTGGDEDYMLFVMTGLEAAGDEISAILGSVKDK